MMKRLLGVIFCAGALPGVAEESVLSFWAERWTSKEPFEFRIERLKAGKWRPIFNGTNEIRVGGFLTQVEVPLFAGVKMLRFVTTTPRDSGLMLDDLIVERVKPMTVTSVTTSQPVVPVLIRKKNNPVMWLQVVTEGRSAVRKLTAVKLDLEGTTESATDGRPFVFF